MNSSRQQHSTAGRFYCLHCCTQLQAQEVERVGVAAQLLHRALAVGKSEDARGIALWFCLNGPAEFLMGPFVIQTAKQPFTQMFIEAGNFP
ncbi:hypothetical protein FHI69_14915 [Janthinobacterium lividum]|uniref:Uncharacterized protein n=1 Tax=Janthinobacterium lividum TaxID=29581 RepID=A0A5C4NQQ5_9BURK|nr:hypothetical protein [Janthinobacterium lividum]TNC76230.1 hypothetical protein FHI69_14915 [Janthinobacterium lividum]